MSNRLEHLDIGVLKLDPLNPRLPDRLKNASEEEVLNWMLTDATLTDLMASIVENGFFGGESLIAIEDEANRGHYIIVEGNRRLAAIKLLSNPGIAEYKSTTVRELSEEIANNGHMPQELPVYVVTDRKEVENYLGYRHVTGVKQWPVIAKARYLHSLFSTMDYTPDVYRLLAKEIGSKSVYVRRLIIGYQLYLKIRDNAFYGLDYLNEENFDLSLINDAATQQSAIEEYMNIDKNAQNPLSALHESEFINVFKWLYEVNEEGITKVGESRNLKLLNKVLATPQAKEAFIERKASLHEAVEFTSLVDENLREYLFAARASIIEAQRLVHRITSPSTPDIKLAEEIMRSAETIQNAMIISKSKTQSA
jgi:hypothetical protein